MHRLLNLIRSFTLLHFDLVHIYGHGFYELCRMLMRKNVNNDVSKDSPTKINDFCWLSSNEMNHKVRMGKTDWTGCRVIKCPNRAMAILCLVYQQS